MAIPQYKIIEAQEEEIVRLKAELSETEKKYQNMRRKFDDLFLKLHGGGN